MIEVGVTRINSVEGGEITREDARTKTAVWLVPVIYELADGYHVEWVKRIIGSEADAQAFHNALPITPIYPTVVVFDDDDELVKVVTRMVVPV